ncbi:MAG: hypothetical protein M1436_10290, partial [Acidobacteria bacterium]|nr:hypothetical protein [Acidobacteriota bacterium]
VAVFQPRRHRQFHAIDRRDKTYGTLEAFAEFIGRFTPPAGDFDPRGAWKQCYAIQLFAEESGNVGYLEIEKRPAGDGVELTVATRLEHSNGRQEENAKLVCAADALGSLRSLQLDSISSDAGGKPVEATRGAVRCEVRGKTIEWTHGGKKRSTPVAPPVVANWALFDAVQRLAPDEAKPIGFTLIDDGDLVKPAQRLVYRGKESVPVAGGENLSLHWWEQTGYGILPTHYWVDGKGRLLFAVAGQKAFLYDAEARNHVAARRRRKA